ncbi:sensor histidine kinase [Sphingomonas sp. RB1R13]|uniref:sensor histidine kinase n=1 Tax=Sphingomonas sp. RB1R13 TaxID=3096159 RepID=UPI002FC76664
MALLGVVVFWAMHVAFTRQLDATVADEVQTLVAEYRSDGGSELADAIAQRELSRSPGRLLYAVFAPNGRRIYGSLKTSRPSLGVHDIAFNDPSEGADAARALAIDLSPNERLVVAADREWIEQIDQTILIVFAMGFLAVCLLGFAGALLFGSYLQRRLRSISDGAVAIIGGDIRGRMPVGPRQDEFDQLAITLNRMLERIEGLLKNLRQVSTDIAHDLRSPLTRLRNRLEQGSSATETQNCQPLIEEAITRVDDVLALFSSILRLSEVESGETRRFFAPVDLSALAHDLFESYAPPIRDSGRTLISSIEPHVTIAGDRELIGQACANLLENAQLHTPPGTIIRLSLVAAGQHVCLQVNDNGPGVGKADRGRMIERFKRLDASRNTPGHGLGLSLANAVAALHGGRLLFRDSQPGLSATFEFPASTPGRLSHSDAPE